MGKPVNIQTTPPTPAESAFPTCKQCGLIHPPAANGSCPIIAGKTEEGKALNEFITRVTPLLTKHEDKDKLLSMLNKTIQAWQIQYIKSKKK